MNILHIINLFIIICKYIYPCCCCFWILIASTVLVTALHTDSPSAVLFRNPEVTTRRVQAAEIYRTHIHTHTFFLHSLSHWDLANRATFWAFWTTSGQRFLRTSLQSWKNPSFLGKPWLPSLNVTIPKHNRCQFEN